jgi:hypothetical protein
MRYRLILFLVLGLDACILFLQIPEVSISSAEADLLYGEFSPLQFLVNSSLKLFGHNDFALRFVMIIFHILSNILLYLISCKYIESQRNRLWLLVIFMMLPGVVSAAIVVNSAGFVIFGLLLFVYLFDKIPQYALILLLAFLMVADKGFVYLFFGLCIYYIFEKNRAMALLNLIFLAINIYLHGIEIHGIPSGHFLDTVGVYSAIFSPVVFIYIVYALYRRYLLNQTDMLWYIATTTLLYSIILSFRQQVALVYCAPYLIISLPLVAQTFISSYRVRLKMFRTGYKVIFIFSFVLLFINFIAVIFNKELYQYIENPKKHFAYKMHVVKELAEQLKANQIVCLKTDNDMQLRLRFYGVDRCNKYLLQELPFKNEKDANVTISYKNKTLYLGSVTNIYNQ